MSAILLSVHRLKNNEIYDRQGNKLGTIADVMIDGDLTHAQYAVMSFAGPLTSARKQFAVPIGALELDTENECFVLDVSKDRLSEAEGFDTQAPPPLPDPLFSAALTRPASPWVRSARPAPT